MFAQYFALLSVLAIYADASPAPSGLSQRDDASSSASSSSSPPDPSVFTDSAASTSVASESSPTAGAPASTDSAAATSVAPGPSSAAGAPASSTSKTISWDGYRTEGPDLLKYGDHTDLSDDRMLSQVWLAISDDGIIVRSTPDTVGDKWSTTGGGVLQMKTFDASDAHFHQKFQVLIGKDIDKDSKSTSPEVNTTLICLIKSDSPVKDLGNGEELPNFDIIKDWPYFNGPQYYNHTMLADPQLGKGRDHYNPDLTMICIPDE